MKVQEPKCKQLKDELKAKMKMLSDLKYGRRKNEKRGHDERDWKLGPNCHI